MRSLDCGFAQSPLDAEQPVTRPEGVSQARYGANMLPLRHQVCGATSPLFHYPYERSREALDSLLRQSEPDDWDGLKLRYVNPATGGWAMPTIGTCMQLLPRGFNGKTYRTSDATVFSVVEGHGRAVIAGQNFDFAPKDTFVVPSWASLSLQAEQECVLFSCSDRPVQQVLGLLRESRENR